LVDEMWGTIPRGGGVKKKKPNVTVTRFCWWKEGTDPRSSVRQ